MVKCCMIGLGKPLWSGWCLSGFRTRSQVENSTDGAIPIGRAFWATSLCPARQDDVSGNLITHDQVGFSGLDQRHVTDFSK